MSRWPAITLTPGEPELALPSMSAGANARLRPDAPASTVSGSPLPGSARRATGCVSAHGHGLAAASPSVVRFQARFSRCCASSALAGSQKPAASNATPSAISTPTAPAPPASLPRARPALEPERQGQHDGHRAAPGSVSWPSPLQLGPGCEQRQPARRATAMTPSQRSSAAGVAVCGIASALLRAGGHGCSRCCAARARRRPSAPASCRRRRGSCTGSRGDARAPSRRRACGSGLRRCPRRGCRSSARSCGAPTAPRCRAARWGCRRRSGATAAPAAWPNAVVSSGRSGAAG